MPVGGIVITTYPEDCKSTESTLAGIKGLSVFGSDEKGNIIAVLDTENSEIMEELIKKVSKIDTVLHVGLTYLNVEDESDIISSGDYSPKIFGDRKNEKNQ